MAAYHIVLLHETTGFSQMTLTSNVLIDSLTCMALVHVARTENVDKRCCVLVYRRAVYFELPYDDVEFISSLTFSVSESLI